MTSIESRVFHRVPYRASVRCAAGDPPHLFAAQTENLSDGGVLLSSSEPLTQGGRLRLSFAIDGIPVEISATVRWSQFDVDRGTWIAGAEFDEDEQGREVVLAAIESLLPTAWADGEPEVLPRCVAVKFIPVVRRIARSVSRLVPLHVDDLIGAGFVGLVEAYRHFRPELIPSFDAYAALRIRGRMMDEARSADTLSRRQRSIGKLLDRTRAEHVARHGREPSPHDLAAALGLKIAEVREVELALVNKQPARDTLFELAGDGSANPETHAIRQEGAAVMKMALSALPERLRGIVVMYYGEQMTLRSIAAVLGVTEARISQLHSEAIRLLRERCGEGEH